MKTLQETFDTVSAHLLSQNERCQNEEEVCAYRGENGLMCAVGVLIEDDAFNKKCNLDAIGESGVMAMLKNSKINTGTKSMSLLHALQTVHDQSNPENWKRSLKDVAMKHGLKHD
jgi:hypothetical protein